MKQPEPSEPESPDQSVEQPKPTPISDPTTHPDPTPPPDKIDSPQQLLTAEQEDSNAEDSNVEDSNAEDSNAGLVVTIVLGIVCSLCLVYWTCVCFYQ